MRSKQDYPEGSQVRWHEATGRTRSGTFLAAESEVAMLHMDGEYRPMFVLKSEWNRIEFMRLPSDILK